MDTAQPVMAAETDPNVQLADAAAAFKVALNPDAARPRADNGQYVSEQPDETELVEDEPEAVEAEDGEDETDEADEEAADEAQPMPPSWPADKADVWAQLPAETQGFIAEREAERERAINAKFQESANERKAASLAAKEAQTKRDEYLAALKTVEGLYKTPQPDPRAFGYGTRQFNEPAYNAAYHQWQQNEQALAQFSEQRATLSKQAQEEQAQAFSEWKQQHETEYAPKLLADVPDLKDAAKAEPLVRGLVNYAIANGIPEDVFAEDVQDQITSAQLHLIWKAHEFDRLRASKALPKPRQSAGPAVKPGVSSPRSAQKASRQQKSYDRLAREGTVEAGAEVFKNFFKG